MALNEQQIFTARFFAERACFGLDTVKQTFDVAYAFVRPISHKKLDSLPPAYIISSTNKTNSKISTCVTVQRAIGSARWSAK